MLRDNLPRCGRGRQGRGYHNINNQQNRSGGGYQNNRAKSKIYPNTSGRQQTTTYDSVK